MKSNGFPEGEYVLNYPARVCKRFNREMFTIIPLLGDVRSLIPFVGFKNSPWDSRRWKTSKSGSANAIQQINTPPTAPFHNCRDGRCPAASPPPLIYPPQTPPPLSPLPGFCLQVIKANQNFCLASTSVCPETLSTTEAVFALLLV